MMALGSTRPASRWARLKLQLPRDKADTLLLLLSSVLVLAPHASHLPLWAGITVAATLLWRALITLRGTRLPPLWLLLPVSLLAMAGVYASFRTLLGREAGVAMLALLLAFKLLEMHAKRDLFVVIFLSFFLLLTNFFYSQSIATGLSMVITIIVLLTAQLSFQYTGAVPTLARRLRLAATMFCLAAPVAVLMFFIFPRIQGPLWGLPDDSHSGRTGLSDNMSPGNVSSLAQSEEIAFRVRFDGAVPAKEKLYWRGLVLSDYDGRTWTRRGASRQFPAVRQDESKEMDVDLIGPPVNYQVTLEPSGKRWLFALELPKRLEGLDNYSSTPALEVFVQKPVDQRTRYSVSSVLDYRWEAREQRDNPLPWLALPGGFNPRTLDRAAQLRQGKQQAEAINSVLKWFREDQFSYTLEPPLLGKNAVDDFLFGSKAGFCEHYAGAFVVLMRAMDIPARVVLGYQGGELNPVDGTLTLRQSDAHAWAEVWLAGRGWVRVDPTAAVAPERIQQNLAGAMPKPSPFGLQGLGEYMARQDSLLSSLRFNWSAINHAWNQWVLDYSPERQRGVLDELGAQFGNWRSLLGGAVLAALLYLSWTLRRRARQDPLEALYAAFCRQQARRGCTRAPSEGPYSYAARLARMAAPPQKQAAIARFLAIYSAIKYGVVRPNQKATAVKTMAKLLNQSR